MFIKLNKMLSCRVRNKVMNILASLMSQLQSADFVEDFSNAAILHKFTLYWILSASTSNVAM